MCYALLPVYRNIFDIENTVLHKNLFQLDFAYIYSFKRSIWPCVYFNYHIWKANFIFLTSWTNTSCQFWNKKTHLQGLAPPLGLIYKWEVRCLTELYNWKNKHKGHLNPIYNNSRSAWGLLMVKNSLSP